MNEYLAARNDFLEACEAAMNVATRDQQAYAAALRAVRYFWPGYPGFGHGDTDGQARAQALYASWEDRVRSTTAGGMRAAEWERDARQWEESKRFLWEEASRETKRLSS